MQDEVLITIKKQRWCFRTTYLQPRPLVDGPRRVERVFEVVGLHLHPDDVERVAHGGGAHAREGRQHHPRRQRNGGRGCRRRRRRMLGEDLGILGQQGAPVRHVDRRRRVMRRMRRRIVVLGHPGRRHYNWLVIAAALIAAAVAVLIIAAHGVVWCRFRCSSSEPSSLGRCIFFYCMEAGTSNCALSKDLWKHWKPKRTVMRRCGNRI